MLRQALAVLLLATPALAQEAPTPITLGQNPQGKFETAGDVDRYTINLKRGNDYAVSGFTPEGGAKLTVRNPSGAVVTSFGAGPEAAFGKEFRAKVTGKHTVEISEGTLHGSYTIEFESDCREGPTTKCNLKPGVEQQREATFDGDNDWFRLRGLRVGRNYEVRIPADETDIAAVKIVRRNGTVIGPDGAFKATAGELYAVVEELYAVVEIDGDATGFYRIVLAAR